MADRAEPFEEASGVGGGRPSRGEHVNRTRNDGHISRSEEKIGGPLCCLGISEVSKDGFRVLRREGGEGLEGEIGCSFRLKLEESQEELGGSFWSISTDFGNRLRDDLRPVRVTHV